MAKHTFIEDHWGFATTAEAESRRLRRLDEIRRLYAQSPNPNLACEAMGLITVRGTGYTERLRRLLDQLIGWPRIDIRVRQAIEAWADYERERLP